MKTKQLLPLNTKVKKSYTHDRMSIKIKFPSGAFLNFSAGRTGERLEVAFSNDKEELKIQTKRLQDWLQAKQNETNQDRFDRLESLATKVRSGKEFMSLIN